MKSCLILFFLLFGAISSPSRREMTQAYNDGLGAMEDFDYVRAVSSFNKSLGLSVDLDDILYQAKSNRKLGEIFYGVYDPEASISYFDKAFESFLAGGDSLAAYETLLFKGLALYQSGSIEESEKLLEQVHDARLLDGEMEVKLDCALAAAYLRLSPPNADKAVHLFETAGISSRVNDIEYLSAYAYALNLVGRKEASREVFSTLSAMGASGFHPYLFWKALSAEADGDFGEAFRLLKSSEEKSKVYQEYRNYVFDAYDSFLSMEVDLAKIQTKNTRLQALVTIIVLSAMIMVLLYSLYRRKKKNEEERQRLYIIVDSLKNKENDVSRKYFSVVSGIMEEYIWGLKKGDSKERVVSFLDNFAADVSGSIKRRESFESIVDKHFDGIMSAFRKDFPNLSDDKYRLFCYSIAGFDPTTVALIMDVSVDAIYMRRSRLRKLIASSNCTQREKYLSLLEVGS